MNSYLSTNSTLFRDMFKPIWLIIAIFLYTSTIVLSNYIFIKPYLKQYEILDKKKSRIEAIYQKIDITDFQKKIEILESQLQSHRNQQQLFAEKTLDRQNLPLVLGELNHIVEVSKLTLNYINPLPPSAKILKKYQKLPISLRLNGKYPYFLEFLKRLEDARYWLLVDNYDINPSKNIGEYTFALTIYTIIR